jgi:hypothetical protein
MVTGGSILLDHRLQRLSHVLLLQSFQSGAGSLQVAVGGVGQRREAHPIPAVVGAQQGRIGVGQLDRIDDPGIDQAQDQSEHQANDERTAVHRRTAHG